MRPWLFITWWALTLTIGYAGYWFWCQPLDWQMYWLEQLQLKTILAVIIFALVALCYYVSYVANEWLEKKARRFRRSNTREVNAMFFETDCPECGETYMWHRELRNQCTRCGADYGHLTTIGEINQTFARYREELKEELKQRLDDE